MDDLSSKLSEILNSEQGKQSLQQLAGMLAGNSGADTGASDVGPLPAALASVLGQGQSSTSAEPKAQAANLPAVADNPSPSNGGLDLSALSGILSGLGGSDNAKSSGGLDLSALTGMLSAQNAPQPQSAPGNGPGGLDLSALASMLSSQTGTGNTGGPDLSMLSGMLSAQKGGAGGGLDLSGLANMLGSLGGAGTVQKRPAQEERLLPNIDLNMIMNIQKAVSMMQQETPSTKMLRAIRPLLHKETQHKIDKAIRMMQLMNLLPMITKSGLLNNLLG